MSTPKMIPIGYLYKTIVAKPEFMTSPSVQDVYSVSSHISADFDDYIFEWQHNGYWLFDCPSIMQAIASRKAIDLSAATLFYYNCFWKQYDGNGKWSGFTPTPSFKTDVRLPDLPMFKGFDVVSCYLQQAPECSPLSCNDLSARVNTNLHCLFNDFQEARGALERGTFADTEEGPFRIIGVHTIG